MNKTMSAALGIALVAGPLLHGATAQTATSAPAAVSAKKDSSKMSAAVAAIRERQKKCGAEWKEAKAGGKVEKGMTWPKYWSACNKRVKETDAKKG